MNIKRIGATVLAAAFVLPTLAFSGCSKQNDTIILRVYNWEEYMDQGGEESYDGTADAPSMTERFESWYEETYGTPIRVEYSTFGTNEDLYNQLRLANEGNSYDLLCPSEYMIMKLAAEDRLEAYDESFFDPSVPENYYIRNVSPYIRSIFEGNKINKSDETDNATWADYAAGYMWGVTGFIYNSQEVDFDELSSLGWDAMTAEIYKNKVTTKDNVRDTYFAALAILYRDEITALDMDDVNYNQKLSEILNRTDDETVQKVEKILEKIDNNIYSYETDTGKNDMVLGNIWLNFAWSGDAVYAMDLAEEEDGVSLSFFIPNECANLWFDGWVMPKGANKQAAQAFVNFLSRPDNAVRNMYYIGYSSVIAGNVEDEEYASTVLDYVKECYEVDEETEDVLLYDLSYFFGQDATFFADSEQATTRQLHAQYPPESAVRHCAVMDYYGEEANENINELWSRIKAESLDAWAIAVLVIAAALIILVPLSAKLGNQIDLTRKPKKGYTLVKQENIRSI